jgi:hypothetical protein
MDKRERLELAVQLVGGSIDKELFATPNRHADLVQILKGAYNIIVEVDRVIPEKGPAPLT